MRNKLIFTVFTAVLISSFCGCSMAMRPSASATLLSSDIKKESDMVVPIGNVVSESDCNYMWSILIVTGNPMPSHERLIGKILERTNADILLDADLSSTFMSIPYIFGMDCLTVSGQPARLTKTKETKK